ncbi:MAG: hypothetical protein J7J38_01955 [Candidatus Aenigmarchaeota archaeon]|nr:hypothetical protein [Candidatus Aenigmarchaeota archaeon]
MKGVERFPPEWLIVIIGIIVIAVIIFALFNNWFGPGGWITNALCGFCDRVLGWVPFVGNPCTRWFNCPVAYG